ncbi:MAG: RT0821/Lpp0805 family surface protein, partial [Alphaproteobacteria bacterium]
PLPVAQAQPATTNTATAPAEPGSAPVTAAAVFNPADRIVTGSTSPRAPAPSPRPVDLSPSAAQPASAASTTPAAAAASMPAGLLPISEADWQVARRSLNEALADRADTPSIAWENEESGARGTVTALQTSIASDGRTCRPFLGSALKQRSENWFEGHACKVGRTNWEIVDIRPWRRN